MSHAIRTQAETLMGLYQMLDAARSQTDIDLIKAKIRDTVFQMGQQSGWPKHIQQGGNQY